MIEADGLVKVYGVHAALRGVTLRVPPGQILAVLGHNGSGKTTLVRLLATLTRPTAGRGRIGGHDLVTGREAVRRLIAVVSHSTHLYEDLTAEENLAFDHVLAGGGGEPERIHAALADVGLEGHSRRRVRQLSSGMQRRVALARAMLRAPRVLLLDEAFSALDQDGGKRLEEHLHAFKAGGGAAMVVTHSLGRALAVADRIVILTAGRVAADVPGTGLSEGALQRLYVDATEGAA